MNTARGIRLPLQIGTSSLWSLARSSASLLPGLGLVPLGVTVAIETGLSRLGISLGVALGMAGVLLAIFAWAHIRYAWCDRPSDVVLSSEGLRVEGGRYHGLSMPWSLVDRSGTCIVADQEDRLTLKSIGLSALLAAVLALIGVDLPEGLKEKVGIRRLRVARRSGGSVVVAEAERPIEQDSLQALLDSIRADQWYGPPDPAARTVPPPVGVVACPGCGAAAVPDETEAVTCPYCGTAVAIPEAVRRGVRDGRVISHERRLSERVLGRLLEQPGARSMGWLFLGASVPMLLAWPLAFGLAGREWELGTLTSVASAKLAFFASAAILSLFFLLRVRLVDRFALRLLTLGFAARAPVNDQAPFTCRRCGAPLPEARDSIHVACVYCRSENLIGLDLGHRAAVETAQADTLGDALRGRSRERRVWSGFGLAAMALLVPATWMLSSAARPGLAPGPGTRRPRVEVVAPAGGIPVALAVDGQAVYWTTRGEIHGAGSILTVSLDGGTPVTIASAVSEPEGLALDQQYVYWSDSEEGTIRRAAKAGGQSTVLASHQRRPTALVRYGGSLYWTNDAPAAGSGDPLGSVMMLTLPDGEPVAMASKQPEPSSLSVDATGVYWTVRGTPRRRYFDGAVLRAGLDGSGLRTVSSDQRDPSGVALDTTTAYWINSGDADQNVVMRVSKRGGGATVLAADQFEAASLAADDTAVYWVSTAGRVSSVPASGGPPRVLVVGHPSAAALALDAAHVYWLTQPEPGRTPTGTVARRLK